MLSAYRYLEPSREGVEQRGGLSDDLRDLPTTLKSIHALPKLPAETRWRKPLGIAAARDRIESLELILKGRRKPKRITDR